MKRLVAGLLILSLAGCGGSKLNPVNWFGGKKKAEVTAPAEIPDPALTDPRPMVDDVLSMTLEKASGGLILRVTGRVPGPGYWGGTLLPLNKEEPVGGVLTYIFRASPPGEPPVPGPTLLSAAHLVPLGALVGTRTIVVRAATNQQSARP